MNIGIPLYAAADGVARINNDQFSTLGRWVCIQHTSNLATIYGHMNTISIEPGAIVESGQLIGTSGNTGTTAAHLHFSVVNASCLTVPFEINPIDPFGWHGTGPDPVIGYSGTSSSCLWRSADQDPISCADRVYEDGSVGTARTGTGWIEENDGHGYQKFRRYNSSGNEIASWQFDVPRTQAAKVYAWIPPLATTHQATYGIWTAVGWRYVTVDQSVYQNRWRLLGTYTFNPNPINNYVVLAANTGEPANTTWVAMDGIKFRSYDVSLPLVIKQCADFDEYLVNGNFENGLAWWYTNRTPPNGVSFLQPRAGGGYAIKLGGSVNTFDFIDQGIPPIPSGPCPVTLSYEVWIHSYEPSTTVRYDLMEVAFDQVDTYVLQVIDNTHVRDTVTPYTLDLSQFKGDGGYIRFGSANNGTYTTQFWIDNVSIKVFR